MKLNSHLYYGSDFIKNTAPFYACLVCDPDKSPRCDYWIMCHDKGVCRRIQERINSEIELEYSEDNI